MYTPPNISKGKVGFVHPCRVIVLEPLTGDPVASNVVRLPVWWTRSRQWIEPYLPGLMPVAQIIAFRSKK